MDSTHSRESYTVAWKWWSVLLWGAHLNTNELTIAEQLAGSTQLPLSYPVKLIKPVEVPLAEVLDQENEWLSDVAMGTNNVGTLLSSNLGRIFLMAQYDSSYRQLTEITGFPADTSVIGVDMNGGYTCVWTSKGKVYWYGIYTNLLVLWFCVYIIVIGLELISEKLMTSSYTFIIHRHFCFLDMLTTTQHTDS